MRPVFGIYVRRGWFFFRWGWKVSVWIVAIVIAGLAIYGEFFRG